VSDALRKRLIDAVPTLSERVTAAAEPLLALRSEDPAFRQLDGPMLLGLARAISTHTETAGFLSHRPALLERLARATASTLSETERALESWAFEDVEDLESCLDALRLLRREETVVAGCLQYAGINSFDEVSRFLSILAETITQRALELALAHVRLSETPSFAVIGMGKLAGMEFTYHSDLDLIFLTEGGADAVDAASRIGQRLISYLATMTGAGVAYSVDTRLRPSGGQGTLVTTFSAFERYQCERAQTWEHLAMLRARPIAGATESAQVTLDRVRESILPGHAPPWQELIAIRKRVEKERGAEKVDTLTYKTGPGGLMDVDFLAGGGLLERGERGCPALPSVPAMLRHAASGPVVEALLEQYGFVRQVEAAARWMSGRGVEALSTDSDSLKAAAVLTDLGPDGPDGPALQRRLVATLGEIRRVYDQVAKAGSIGALET